MNNGLQITVIDSLDRWKESAKNWNDLLSQSRANTVFLTWEWLYSWAETYLNPNRELFILFVYKGRALVGVAPFCIHKFNIFSLTIRQLEFLASRESGADYLDVFIESGKEQQVAESIFHFLFVDARKRWDRMQFNDIQSNSLFLLHFLNEVDKKGKYISLNIGAYCPITILPRTTEKVLALLGSRRRSEVKTAWKTIYQTGHVEHGIVVAGQCGATEILKTLFLLHRNRWPEMDDRFYGFLEKFILRVEPNKWVQISFIKVRDRLIAAQMHFVYAETFSYYLWGIDLDYNRDLHLGNLIISSSMERAIEANACFYDFLKGGEQYKLAWANHGRRALTVIIYQRRIRSVLLVLVQCLKDCLKILLR